MIAFFTWRKYVLSLVVLPVHILFINMPDMVFIKRTLMLNGGTQQAKGAER